MPQALGLPTLLILALAAPAAMADSYYLGVTGGYSQFRDAQFEIGADSGTRVTGNYGGGDTLSLTLGHASEGSSTYNGRAEFEFGFQRDTVDSMRFDDTAGMRALAAASMMCPGPRMWPMVSTTPWATSI